MNSDTIKRWQKLLSLALQHLESIGLQRSDWVWGGGTVLMLRHYHRLSWDIDLFLNDPQHLTYLSPRLNNTIDETISHYTEQANHLRCFVANIGEIDYLLAAPVIDVKPEWMDIQAYGLLPVMSDREILAQKIHYRSAGFTGRDLFDFAMVTMLRPELLKDGKLRKIGEIRKRALENRLDAPDLEEDFKAVTLHPDASLNLDFEQARDALQSWLEI